MGQPCQNPSVAGEKKKCFFRSRSLFLFCCKSAVYADISAGSFILVLNFFPCLLLPVFVLGVSLKKLKKKASYYHP